MAGAGARLRAEGQRMSAPDRGLLYTTLRGEGHGELEDRRSVFLSHASPVRTEEEALAFVKARQKEFSDATHNVWAFRLGSDTVARYSDDGEPQGSSGMPTLEAIRHTGATDAVVVVTRYFGGTLLGVGGLIRAYSSAARLALEDAGIITYERYAVLSLAVSYSDYQRLLPEISRAGALTDAQDFAEQVTLTLAVKVAAAAPLCERVRELTAGRCIPVQTGERYDYR